MLLSVIRAYEENRCFYVEEHSDLISRDKSAKQFDSFVERYFDPIGLPSDDPIIVQAKDEGRLATLEWKDVWFQHRKQHGNQHTIDNLGYENMDGHILKRIMLQRMWRLNPKVKAKTCQQLEQTLGHEEYDFLAFSIRRGDKINENFKLTPLGEYIREAERVIAQHFIGMQAPKIFVATDDCRVMNKLRSLKPNWTFVSMCDDSNGNENGFRLADMRVWTQEETDRHFFKFFVELYALTISKYYIGVGYTNVAWWTFFMRTHARWTTTLLDHPADFGALVNNW